MAQYVRDITCNRRPGYSPTDPGSDLSSPALSPAKRPARIPSRGRRGFSFVEILFAVMILGIGFIMIAGVFPVALNQTQANGDETVAATLARQGAATIANLPNTALLMSTDGNLHRFGPGVVDPATNYDGDYLLWNELSGCQVLSEDPRYAWVPFYCRRKDPAGLAGDTAQVTIIGVRVRNRDAYIPSNAVGGDMALSGSGLTALATLIGKPVTITNVNANNTLATPDQLTFGGANIGAIAPGTFVVIATDKSPNTTGTSAVGWVLKVGNPAPGANTFYLQPGGDMKNSTLYKPNTTGGPLNAFVIGQGADPDIPGTFTGGAQDIMAYTTFIPLH